VDYTLPAAESARIVIAQMNNNLPRTGGARISLDSINYIVEKDEPLIELKPPKIGDLEKQIGENVAALIPDGATLQLGIGAIPDAVLLFLKNKKDLGIHSEMFSDGVVVLAEAGVITNRKKTQNPGKFIATFLMGTQKLYDFVNNNPDVELRPVDYTNDPYVIGSHDNMMSINSALQVDFMGQVNAEMIGSRQFSGIGGQVDFVAPADHSAVSQLSHSHQLLQAGPYPESVVSSTLEQLFLRRVTTYTILSQNGALLSFAANRFASALKH